MSCPARPDTDKVLYGRGYEQARAGAARRFMALKLEHTGRGVDPRQSAGKHSGTTRAVVDVTFLRQTAPPANFPSLPEDCTLGRVRQPNTALYRYLYNTVGASYLWWLRRTMPDHEIATLLASPGVSLHVLTRDHQPAGFFELDARPVQTVNLSYFGLMPHAIGQGLGQALLAAAMQRAWAHGPRALTVNTCTADHPRALPNYLAAGFVPVRTAREIWEVPNELGLVVPERLRQAALF